VLIHGVGEYDRTANVLAAVETVNLYAPVGYNASACCGFEMITWRALIDVSDVNINYVTHSSPSGPVCGSTAGDRVHEVRDWQLLQRRIIGSARS
jgi:hypothetical protein